MSIIELSLIAVSLTAAGLSLLIAQGEKSLASKVFSFFILCISLWAYGIFSFQSTQSLLAAIYYSDFNYVIALCIAVSFFHFSVSFPNLQKNKSPTITYYIIPILLLVILICKPFLIIVEVYLKNDIKLTHINTPIYILYTIIFCLYWFYAYKNLWTSYTNTKITSTRNQLRYIFYGTLIPLLVASYFDLFFALINYRYVWIGPLMGFLVVCIILYSVYKHHLFNLKLFLAEIVTFSLWIIILIRTLSADNAHEIFVEIAVLIITIVFGILLILTLIKNLKQKEELTSLNQHLSDKVAEQTKEIRAAYDLEKHARRELEKLNETKDQFIMITQHHLRTPVTGIEWELEAMLDGNYGKVPEKIKAGLLEAKSAVGRLTHIIDDFLNITAIKTGQNILTLAPQSLLPLIEDILKELKPDIARLSLDVSYPKDPDSWENLNIDAQKMRDTLLIVIENAAKYNRENGRIDIKTERSANMFVINIENTGIGITAEEIGKIGTALFYRGLEARARNTIGMGVGLSVAKAIIKAHRGTFEIRSNGKDRGASVIISIPTYNT